MEVLEDVHMVGILITFYPGSPTKQSVFLNHNSGHSCELTDQWGFVRVPKTSCIVLGWCHIKTLVLRTYFFPWFKGNAGLGNHHF